MWAGNARLAKSRLDLKLHVRKKEALCLRALRYLLRVPSCYLSLRLQYLVVCVQSHGPSGYLHLTFSASIAGSAVCWYNCSERGRPYFSHRLQWTIPATLSCLFLYTPVPACCFHSISARLFIPCPCTYCASHIAFLFVYFHFDAVSS